MDSYNRGYDAEIADGGENDPDGLGHQNGATIGNAKVIANAETALDPGVAKSGGFYAVSYTLDEAVDDLPAGTIVISYRGTNDLKDVWTNIQTITGIVGFPEQFRLAAQFYQAVKAANPGANIVLTGHSPCGGLHPARKRLAPGRPRCLTAKNRDAACRRRGPWKPQISLISAAAARS